MIAHSMRALTWALERCSCDVEGFRLYRYSDCTWTLKNLPSYRLLLKSLTLNPKHLNPEPLKIRSPKKGRFFMVQVGLRELGSWTHRSSLNPETLRSL